MTEQLPLPLKLFDDATFANYIPGSHHEIVNYLQNLIDKEIDRGIDRERDSAQDTKIDPVINRKRDRTQDKKQEHFIYLWGPWGSGKSHLLQACYHLALETNKQAFYLSLNDYHQLTPDIFDGLEKMDLLCLDDIEAITNDDQWQQALFHLYNRIHDNNKLLIISCKQSPSESGFKLADLHSRLSWGITFHLQELSDSEKAQALKLHAKIRGINLTTAVLEYIFKYYSRNMHDLLSLLAKLEQQSLIEQRRITVPFLKRVISV